MSGTPRVWVEPLAPSKRVRIVLCSAAFAIPSIPSAPWVTKFASASEKRPPRSKATRLTPALLARSASAVPTAFACSFGSPLPASFRLDAAASVRPSKSSIQPS